MSGQNTHETLERLWGEVPVGQAPVADIIRGGKAARSRKRATTLGAGLAIVIVGAVAFRGGAVEEPASEHRVDTPVAAAATPVDLPTSDWTPKDPSQLALAVGHLGLDHRGCVYLGEPAPVDTGDTSSYTPGPYRSYLVWPAGYTANVADGGTLTLYDANGTAVAHDGDRIEVGGGYTLVTRKTAHPCLPEAGKGEAFYVQSSVTVIS
jgi:hypothetical protein